jgi:hypothetical protein
MAGRKKEQFYQDPGEKSEVGKCAKTIEDDRVSSGTIDI